MSVYYSASARGFFHSELHDIIPTDAVAVTDAAYQALMDGQASGQTITTDNSGNPILTTPTPSAALVAARALAVAIGNGITITCIGASALSGVYALDQNTMDQIGAVARDFSAGLGLPGGAATFGYPNAGGSPVTFTGIQLCELYKAQRDLLFLLNQQAAIMGAGGAPVWPAQTATIP